MSTYEISCCCIKGRREKNDDRILVNGIVSLNGIQNYRISNEALLICCDGVSGQKGGAAAADLTVGTFSSLYSEGLINPSAIEVSCYFINKDIIRRRQESSELSGMATTIVGLYLKDGMPDFAFSCGDSRLYSLSEEGLCKVSVDDTVSQFLRECGIDPPRCYDNCLAHCLGSSSYALRRYTPDGSLYMLCSDGISSFISEDELELILKSDGSTGLKLQKILKTAYIKSDDNMSMILVQKVTDEQKGDTDE